MPRYFFHVHEGTQVSHDREGQILDDLGAARQEAVNTARELVGERLLHGGAVNGRKIEIVDEEGRLLAVVETHDVLYQDGRYRSYADDVTKSAPVMPLSAKCRPE